MSKGVSKGRGGIEDVVTRCFTMFCPFDDIGGAEAFHGEEAKYSRDGSLEAIESGERENAKGGLR